MWCPDDESLCTRNREITLHSSDQDDTISSIPTTLSQSSPLTIFPVKRAASNEFGEDVVDRKVRRLDRDGINSVISPFLGYVDVMNNERNKSSVCGYHIQVQNELKVHPQIIHCDDIVDGMAMEDNADDSCHSEMDIQATFDATSPSKVDAELCSREKIRATTSIHQIIRQLSSTERPSPFLIFTFVSSLSNLLVSMNGNERESLLGSVCSSLPPSLPIDESDR